MRAARAWSIWEGSTSRLHQDPKLIARSSGEAFAEALARIECHYFVHGSFLRHPDQLLDDVERVRRIPAVIVQGRYDLVCPMVSAWELHRRWPEAELHVVPDAGHSAMEPGTIDRLVEATDRFRTLA
jgi:proline iminopeptidase